MNVTHRTTNAPNISHFKFPSNRRAAFPDLENKVVHYIFAHDQIHISEKQLNVNLPFSTQFSGIQDAPSTGGGGGTWYKSSGGAGIGSEDGDA